jgi:hypothetical protein
LCAGELEKAEEVLSLPLPASDQTALAQEPGEEPLDAPAVAVAAQLPAILSLVLPRGQVRRDHLDAHGRQFGVEPIAVVGLVADEFLRQRLDEAGLQGFNDKPLFMSLTTRNPNGERKAMAVCHCHDLGRFAAASDPNKRTPLFAPAWEPST